MAVGRDGARDGARQAAPEQGGLERALADGNLVRSYAFGGGSYVFTPDDGASLLTVHTATRLWESPRFQRQAGVEVEDWQVLRDAVRDALEGGPLTREEIADHLARVPALRHLAPAAASGAGSDTLYKPLDWWGDICFGPDRDGRSTFRLLRGAPSEDEPDVDAAGRHAILRYLEAYAPATRANLHHWLTEGLGAPRRRVDAWLTDLRDAVVQVRAGDVDAYVLASDVDGLLAAEPSEAVHVLPAHDPWVSAPGTADARVVPPGRRALVSQGAGLITRGGVLAGTWRAKGAMLTASWFREAGAAPAAALERGTALVAAVRGRDLTLEIAVQ